MQVNITRKIEELKVMCTDANNIIVAILKLDNQDLSKISNTVANLTNNIIDESVFDNNIIGNNVIDVSYFEGDGKSSGNYLVVTLDNGKKFPVFQQVNGYWHRIRMGNGEEVNLGGGCSIFSLTSAIAYLTDNPHLPVRNVIPTGGMFGGMYKAFSGKVPIEVDGVKYRLDSDFSEKKSYGGSSDKETVVADIENTLKSGGVVLLNISARTQPIKETIDGVIKIKVPNYELEAQTGITSQSGHMIAMMGLTPDGEIIFADSVYREGSETFCKKGLTVNDWYDIYGGKSPTHVKSKYYHTETYVEMNKVEDE